MRKIERWEYPYFAIFGVGITIEVIMLVFALVTGNAALASAMVVYLVLALFLLVRMILS